MNIRTRSIALMTLACCVPVMNASLGAQSGDDAVSRSAPERTSSTAVREYVPAEFTSAVVSIPSNIIIPDGYRNLLEEMLRRSPTFRRQCRRIAAEPHLTISVHVAPRPPGAGIRAISHITRAPSGLTALIEVNSSDDEVELLSHELEHVIEQLDQVDLQSKAARSDSGVHRMVLDAPLFETIRATRTGLKVALEMRGGARRAD